MATVTIVFRKDKINKKGEAPIHFRITSDKLILVNLTCSTLPFAIRKPKGNFRLGTLMLYDH